MASGTHLLGVFDDGAAAARAITRLRDGGLEGLTAYGPAPNHDVEAALGEPVSPVRTFTLIGALLGCVSGFALPLLTVRDWPLITGGKALYSIPPFVVIAFELTILFGAIAGMLGFLTLSRLPRLPGLTRPATTLASDPRFSHDCFGVLIPCDDESQRDAARAALEAAGAVEIRSDE